MQLLSSRPLANSYCTTAHWALCYRPYVKPALLIFSFLQNTYVIDKWIVSILTILLKEQFDIFGNTHQRYLAES